MNHLNTEPAKVHARRNTGDDVYLIADTLIDALLLATHERNPTNCMVCIEIDDERTHRWDRNSALNVNRWRKRDLDAHETFGQLSPIYRAG